MKEVAGDKTVAGKRFESRFTISDTKRPRPAPPGIVLRLHVFAHFIETAQFLKAVEDKLPAAIPVPVHLALAVLGTTAGAVEQALGAKGHRAKPSGTLDDALTAERAIFGDEIVSYRLPTEYSIASGVDRTATQGMEAQSFSHALMVLFVIFGNIVYFYNRRRGGKA